MSNAPVPAIEPIAETPDHEPRFRRAVRALISSSSGILLVEERHADGRPFWTLPGGGVRSEERLLDGLRRELQEELGCKPVVDDVVSSFLYAHESTRGMVSFNTVFSCRIPSAIAPVRSEGIVDATWADPEDLPPATLPQVQCLLDRRDC
jgi:8-oxo-dGTP diphosphatase